jgi:2-oxoglutarate ferredoxin oxidoreductase subunit alpha
MAQYSERADDYVANLDRLAKKFDTARTLVPGPVDETVAGATVGIIAYGSSHWAIVETRDQLRAEEALETSYLRLRAYPFSPAVEDFVRRHDRVYVVEQNRDGQMMSLLRMDLDPTLQTRLRSVLHYSGLPMDARSVSQSIVAQEKQ